MPIHQGKKIIFIHIPKAAGTSVEIAMGAFGINNSGDNSIFCPSILFGRTTQHMTYFEIEKSFERMNLVITEYESFCIVRHPATRIASEYNWRRNWDQSIAGWSFLEFCIHFLKDVSCQEMNFDNRHFVPQSNFPSSTSLVFKLEDQLDDLADFLKSKGILGGIGRHNVATEDPYDDFWEKNEACLEIIESVYEQDYRNFGYKLRPWSNNK